MRVDFIRHGHCLGDAFLRGRSPAKLSELGQQQMSTALDHLGKPEWVVSSPAARCADLVNLYYESKAESPKVELWPDFQERSFGVWDGLSYEAIQALDAKGFQDYLDHPFDYEIAEAESLPSFESRVKLVFDQLLNRASTQQLNHIAVVTHGGVMRVLLQQVLGLSHESLFQFEIGFGVRMTLECFEVEAQFQQTQETTKNSNYFIKLVELVQNPLVKSEFDSI